MIAGDQLPLALVVFAFNEGTNVPVVLPEILRWLRQRSGPYELVFVDDGSTDDTRSRAQHVLAGDPHCSVISRPSNGGIGAALKSGVRAATQSWVTFLPCDGQIPVDDLGLLTDAAVRDDVRVVFSVYESRNDGFHRTLLSAGVRSLIFAVHGVVMRSDGPYLFRRELFDADALKPDSFFLNFEFPIRMLRSGERHGTVTIRCIPRISGRSKSTGWKRIWSVARDLVELRMRVARE